MITTTPLRQTTTPVRQVGECPDSGVAGRSYVSGYGDQVSFGRARVHMFVDHSVTIDGTCAVMSGGRSPVPNETRVSCITAWLPVGPSHATDPMRLFFVFRLFHAPPTRERRECVQSAIR
jgi:hypothetical protein